MDPCIVRGCPFPHTHITQGHVCRLCGKRGHGVVHCSSEQQQKKLRRTTRHHHINKCMRCTVPGCRYPSTHITLGHSVFSASPGRRSPAALQCAKATMCPICKQDVKQAHNVFVDAQCAVCMQRNVRIIFSPCRHACVCNLCYKQL